MGLDQLIGPADALSLLLAPDFQADSGQAISANSPQTESPMPCDDVPTPTSAQGWNVTLQAVSDSSSHERYINVYRFGSAQSAQDYEHKVQGMPSSCGEGEVSAWDPGEYGASGITIHGSPNAVYAAVLSKGKELWTVEGLSAEETKKVLKAVMFEAGLDSDPQTAAKLASYTSAEKKLSDALPNSQDLAPFKTVPAGVHPGGGGSPAIIPVLEARQHGTCAFAGTWDPVSGSEDLSAADEYRPVVGAGPDSEPTNVQYHESIRQFADAAGASSFVSGEQSAIPNCPPSPDDGGLPTPKAIVGVTNYAAWTIYTKGTPRIPITIIDIAAQDRVVRVIAQGVSDSDVAGVAQVAEKKAASGS